LYTNCNCFGPTVPSAEASVENLLEKDEEGKKKGLEPPLATSFPSSMGNFFFFLSGNKK
jgi:hypothetical protein